jgi:hypothetical protein
MVVGYMNILKNSILTLLLVLQLFSNAFASGAVFDLKGTGTPGEVQLGKLKNGQSLEIEFKLIETTPDSIAPNNNSEFILLSRQKGPVGDGRIIIKHISGRWCIFYYPPGSSSYAKKYYTYLPISDDGVNRIRIERNEDWAVFYCNKVLLGSIPLKSGDFISLLQVYNMKIQYRWVSQNFDKSTAKNSASTTNTGFSSVKTKPVNDQSNISTTTFVEIPGGYYRMIDTDMSLNDGDKIKFAIDVMQIHRNPKWSSSVAFMIDSSTIWMSAKSDQFLVQFDAVSGKYDQKQNTVSLKRKPNIIVLARKGNKISITVNGVYTGSYIHDDSSEMTRDYFVTLKFVGVKVKYGFKKIQNGK